MIINISLDELKAFLENSEDAEMLSEGEYVADLFDTDKPVTVNVKFEKDACHVLAAAYLLYDDQQDGWYMGERIEDEAVVLKAFEDAMRENQ
ncbi:MAG: hypothetical protein IIX93_02470 [Clostridia bacterium]|nr:hypothetical protein [Clostridia bacterium]